MSLRTFLGPILNGTVKNNNPVIVTSNTPSANFLTPSPLSGAGQSGGYRNTGSNDGLQFITIPQATLTAIPAASFPYTFYPTYSVSGVNYPIVLPAGSYIDNIDLNIFTAVGFSGTPTGFVISVNLVGAPGSTYATPVTIATAGTTASVTILNTAGNYALGNSNTTSAAGTPLVTATTAMPMITNVGPTDVMMQLTLTFTGGTTPAISAGSIGFAFSYAIRNPDGTNYPQTPTSPIANPPVATY